MKIDCRHSEVKGTPYQAWHIWFAWTPTMVGPQNCRWLEFIERKGTFQVVGFDFWYSWEYRPWVRRHSWIVDMLRDRMGRAMLMLLAIFCIGILALRAA